MKHRIFPHANPPTAAAPRLFKARAAAFFGPIKRIINWLDNHWIGDLIGGLCLFILLFGGLLAGFVLK